jgi:hypothetical protein
MEPFSALDDTLRLERRASVPYRSLSPRDCQCLAARASSTGNLLDQKADSCAPQCAAHHFGHHRSHRLSDLQQQVLRNAALEDRNRSAGEALEQYYRLAESEAKSDLLKQSLATIDEGIEKGRMLREKGFVLGEEFESLRRQRIAALGSEIELTTAIERLNLQLQRQLRLGPEGERWRIWASANWSVVAEPLNVQAAITAGLARRPGLVLLRRILDQLDGETAPAVRAVLGQANSLLAMSCAGRLSFGKLLLQAVCGAPQADEEEVESLRRELRSLLSDREQAVALEIQHAALDVQYRLRRIAVAREEVLGWKRRVDELTARSEQGIETFPESTTARLRLLEARGELVQQVMAWNTARARLEQAQGMLAEACGFVGGPPVP